MDHNEYRQLEQDIKQIVSDALKNSVLEHIAPLARRIDDIERQQSTCPARRSFSGIGTILGRGINIVFIGLMIYTLRLILRPEVWQFLQTAAGIQ